jgi:hypothetical protein
LFERLTAKRRRVSLARNGASSTATLTASVGLTAIQQWRQTNFGSPSNTGDAADGADPDGDGQKNAAEFTAGTDPQNGADRFAVTRLEKIGGTYRIRIDGKAGRIYRLWRSSGLSGGWTGRVTVGPLATASEIVLEDTPAADGPVFFQVTADLP